MPLLKGKSNIGHNITVEEEHGKPKKQALAIALKMAGVKRAKDVREKDKKRCGLCSKPISSGVYCASCSRRLEAGESAGEIMKKAKDDLAPVGDAHSASTEKKYGSVKSKPGQKSHEQAREETMRDATRALRKAAKEGRTYYPPGGMVVENGKVVYAKDDLAPVGDAGTSESEWKAKFEACETPSDLGRLTREYNKELDRGVEQINPGTFKRLSEAAKTELASNRVGSSENKSARLARHLREQKGRDDLAPVGAEDPERAVALKKHEEGVTKSQDKRAKDDTYVFATEREANEYIKLYAKGANKNRGKYGWEVRTNDVMPVGDASHEVKCPKCGKSDDVVESDVRPGKYACIACEKYFSAKPGGNAEDELPTAVKPVGLVPLPSGEGNEVSYAPRKAKDTLPIASQQVKDLYERGLSAKAIAKKMGFDLDSVERIIKNLTKAGIISKARDAVTVGPAFPAELTQTQQALQVAEETMDNEAVQGPLYEQAARWLDKAKDKGHPDRGGALAKARKFLRQMQAVAMDSRDARDAGPKDAYEKRMLAELKQEHGSKYSDDVLLKSVRTGREPWSIQGGAKDTSTCPKCQGYGNIKGKSYEAGGRVDRCKACNGTGQKAKDRSKATDFAGTIDPQSHLDAAAAYEIGGDRARALDAYRAAASGFRKASDKARETQARDGVEACQTKFAQQYDHPGFGRTKVCDSAEHAMRTALERTRAGEVVSVVGKTVRPGRARDAELTWDVKFDDGAVIRIHKPSGPCPYEVGDVSADARTGVERRVVKVTAVAAAGK